KVEIFFPHNVYPFGVLGLRQEPNGKASSLVCLSSGGLSGRVGNTLEGITRIMFDFFGCVDAMVLDEGYDVFFVNNPQDGAHGYKYTNEELLKKILAFTEARMKRDQEGSIKASPKEYPGGMKDMPLNKLLVDELEADLTTVGTRDYSDVLAVEPQR